MKWSRLALSLCVVPILCLVGCGKVRPGPPAKPRAIAEKKATPNVAPEKPLVAAPVVPPPPPNPVLPPAEPPPTQPAPIQPPPIKPLPPLKLEKLDEIQLDPPEDDDGKRKKRRRAPTLAGAGFSADGKLLWLIGEGGGYAVWDVAERKFIITIPGIDSPPFLGYQRFIPRPLFRVTSTGTTVEGQTFRLTDSRKDPVDDPLAGKGWAFETGGTPNWVSLNRDGTVVVASLSTGPVFWDAFTKQPWDSPIARALKASPSAANAKLEFSPTGKWILEAQNQTAEIWDIAGAKKACTLKTSGSFIAHWAFTPDGKQVAISHGDMTIWLYDCETGQGKQQIDPGNKRIVLKEMMFSPDGKTLAVKLMNSPSGSAIQFWDVAAGVLRAELATAELISNFDLSPDGQTACVIISNVVHTHRLKEGP